MQELIQIIYGRTTLELGVYWGILLGFRTFEANEVHQAYELHLYIPFIYVAIVQNVSDEEDLNL